MKKGETIETMKAAEERAAFLRKLKAARAEGRYCPCEGPHTAMCFKLVA